MFETDTKNLPAIIGSDAGTALGPPGGKLGGPIFMEKAMSYFSNLDMQIRSSLGFMPDPGPCSLCGGRLAIVGFDGSHLQVYCTEQGCCNEHPHWVEIPRMKKSPPTYQRENTD